MAPSTTTTPAPHDMAGHLAAAGYVAGQIEQLPLAQRQAKTSAWMAQWLADHGPLATSLATRLASTEARLACTRSLLARGRKLRGKASAQATATLRARRARATTLTDLAPATGQARWEALVLAVLTHGQAEVHTWHDDGDGESGPSGGWALSVRWGQARVQALHDGRVELHVPCDYDDDGWWPHGQRRVVDGPLAALVHAALDAAYGRVQESRGRHHRQRAIEYVAMRQGVHHADDLPTVQPQAHLWAEAQLALAGLVPTDERRKEQQALASYHRARRSAEGQR